MNFRNIDDEYGLISKLLHWLLAVAMISLIAVGWYMTRLSDEDILYWRLLDFHEASGLGVLLLVVMKAVWMRISPNPRQLPDLTVWERYAARIVHVSFIVAMIVSLFALYTRFISGMDRVSAPFEKGGTEPNTLGGYLVMIMCVAT